MSGAGATTGPGGSPAGDPPGAEQVDALGVDDCWTLLGARETGRLGVVGGCPVVLPVRYATDGRTVVLRTGAGALAPVTSGAEVVLEVASLDLESRTGWSVLVRGLLEDVGRLLPCSVTGRQDVLRAR